MYIKSVSIENFRCYGNKVTFEFNYGLNVLIGENDCGKTAVVDAIRYALGTTDQRWTRVEVSDFYQEDLTRTISVSIVFGGLNDKEAASFLEFLTTVNNHSGKSEYILCFNWKVKYDSNMVPGRMIPSYTTGLHENQSQLPAEARELLRVTYLQPLRDAYSQMRAGKGSRLAQIISSLPDVNKKGKKREDLQDLSELDQLKLTAIYDLANDLLAGNSDIKKVNENIEKIINDQMMIGNDKVTTEISAVGSSASITEEAKLRMLLQKLDLNVKSVAGVSYGSAGLGTSNLLSMACEMLLNQQTTASTFMLVEEPEAHVHAQRQLKLIQSIQEEAEPRDHNHQIIITTHSPLLASVVKLENLILIQNRKPYSLKKGLTRLEYDDYRYLEAYLDATKANLFFARGVLIVEGPGEMLLLPSLARIMGLDLTSNGISIVNVNSTGLRRFARIFQRADDKDIIDVPVACITDRDVMPDCAPGICVNKKYADKVSWPERSDRKWLTESDLIEGIEKDKITDARKAYIDDIRNRADGQKVKTFVADHWTLEYDLAYAGLGTLMLETISYIKSIKASRKTQSSYLEEYTQKYNEYATPEEKASYVYSFFSKGVISKAEFEQYFSVLLEDKLSSGDDSIEKSIPDYLRKAIHYASGK